MVTGAIRHLRRARPARLTNRKLRRSGQRSVAASEADLRGWINERASPN